MKNKKLLFIAGKGLSSQIILNALYQSFGVDAAIFEEKESTKTFLKRRIKKLGYLQVAGQIMFQLVIVPLLRRQAAVVIDSMLHKASVDTTQNVDIPIHEVASANDNSVIELIQNIQPDLIVINGTRILSKKLLAAISCPVINMHAGITPKYRGVHGAYWALVNDDKKNCGVTVHLVDAGVDTGEVLYQSLIKCAPEDNFLTYPIKQLVAGIPFLLKAVEDAFSNKLTPYSASGNSKQWYHPTIWQYLYMRIKKGIK